MCTPPPIWRTASVLLPVSNLTNLLAFAACGLSFTRFAALMAPPWAPGYPAGIRRADRPVLCVNRLVFGPSRPSLLTQRLRGLPGRFLRGKRGLRPCQQGSGSCWYLNFFFACGLGLA